MFNEVKKLCWGPFHSAIIHLIDPKFKFYKLNNPLLGDVGTTANLIAGLQFRKHNSTCQLPGGQDLVS
jgi:hypothetical protein